MEEIMRVHLAAIAAAALVATSAFAQPAPSDSRPTAQSDQHRPDLVLASADSVRVQAPAADQPSQPTKRPRAARVTSCRCGDSAATPDGE
jgi:ethanolamine ammonia-lyase small subunit